MSDTITIPISLLEQAAIATSIAASLAATPAQRREFLRTLNQLHSILSAPQSSPAEPVAQPAQAQEQANRLIPEGMEPANEHDRFAARADPMPEPEDGHAAMLHKLMEMVYEYGKACVYVHLSQHNSLGNPSDERKHQSAVWCAIRDAVNHEWSMLADACTRHAQDKEYWQEQARSQEPSKPMTDEEMLKALHSLSHEPPVRLPPGWKALIRAVEAHHGITATKGGKA